MRADELLQICESIDESGGSATLGTSLMKRANWMYDDEGNMVIINPDGGKEIIPTLDTYDKVAGSDDGFGIYEGRAYPLKVSRSGGELVLRPADTTEIDNLVLAYAGKYEFDAIGRTELRLSLDSELLAKRKLGMLQSKVPLLYSPDTVKYETTNVFKVG